MFEKEVRVKAYKNSEYLKFGEIGAEIDTDIEETKFLYVILRGQVSLVKIDYELGVELPISTLKVGESFGDLSS